MSNYFSEFKEKSYKHINLHIMYMTRYFKFSQLYMLLWLWERTCFELLHIIIQSTLIIVSSYVHMSSLNNKDIAYCTKMVWQCYALGFWFFLPYTSPTCFNNWCINPTTWFHEIFSGLCMLKHHAFINWATTLQCSIWIKLHFIYIKINIKPQQILYICD